MKNLVLFPYGILKWYFFREALSNSARVERGTSKHSAYLGVGEEGKEDIREGRTSFDEVLWPIREGVGQEEVIEESLESDDWKKVVDLVMK